MNIPQIWKNSASISHSVVIEAVVKDYDLVFVQDVYHHFETMATEIMRDVTEMVMRDVYSAMQIAR